MEDPPSPSSKPIPSLSLAADFAALNDEELKEVVRAAHKPSQFRILAAQSRAKSVVEKKGVENSLPEEIPDPDGSGAMQRISEMVAGRRESGGCRVCVANMLTNSWFFLVLDLLTLMALVAYLIFNYYTGYALYDPDRPATGDDAVFEEGDVNVIKYIYASEVKLMRSGIDNFFSDKEGERK